MGILKFWRKEEIRADTPAESEPAPAAEVVSFSTFLQSLLGTDLITKEMALQIPTVSGCIDKIAATIASVPVNLYRYHDGEKPERITDDHRLYLLNHDTGDVMQSSQFMRAMVEDYFLGRYGGYAYINRDISGIQSLHYISDRELALQDNNDPIFKDFSVWVRGKSYLPYQFLRVMRKTTDGIRSRTIVEDNPLLISTAYQSLKFENAMVKRGGAKGGLLTPEKTLTREAREALQDAVKNQGIGTPGQVNVLNANMKFSEASLTSVEMQLNENKESNAIEICKLFGVPPTVLTGKMTEKDREEFLRTCTSIMSDFEKSMDRDLLLESEKSSMGFKFDTNELTRGNLKDKFEAYQIALKNSWMTVDEVREKEGLENLDFGFIQLGLDSVLYDPIEKTVYTPNTNAIAKMDGTAAGAATVAPGQVPEARAYSGKNVIVTGPPGSGKTTWVRKTMEDGDIIVDLDAIKAALLGNKDGDFHAEISDDKVKLLQYVQKVLKDATHAGIPETKVWFLTTWTDKKALDEWAEYCNADIHVMDTTKEKCIEQVKADETRPDKDVFFRLINEWFENASDLMKGVKT